MIKTHSHWKSLGKFEMYFRNGKTINGVNLFYESWHEKNKINTHLNKKINNLFD